MGLLLLPFPLLFFYLQFGVLFLYFFFYFPFLFVFPSVAKYLEGEQYSIPVLHGRHLPTGFVVVGFTKIFLLKRYSV